jgi:hypothetical protein
MAIAFTVSDDRLFECGHAARLRLVHTQPPHITAIARSGDAVTTIFTQHRLYNR